MKLYGKLKSTSVLMLDFELEIQKQHPYLIFMGTILIPIDNAFKCTLLGLKFSMSHFYSYNTHL